MGYVSVPWRVCLGIGDPFHCGAPGTSCASTRGQGWKFSDWDFFNPDWMDPSFGLRFDILHCLTPGEFLKWWVSPTTIGFPTKIDQHLGCEMGVPPSKETPTRWFTVFCFFRFCSWMSCYILTNNSKLVTTIVVLRGNLSLKMPVRFGKYSNLPRSRWLVHA